jgi:transcriptional regulator with XRE-family HTH domain
MSHHDSEKIQSAFGAALARARRERNMTPEVLGDASRLSGNLIRHYECGEYAPTLVDFFRIAWALGKEPVLLLVDMVGQWRANPRDLGLYKSRTSDLAKLYRLGYHPDVGEFCELPRTYDHIDAALLAARMLNDTRRLRGRPLLDTVTTYVRLANAPVDQEVTP